MGITVYLGRTGDVLCPVSVLLAYLAIRPPTPGPLFLLKSGDPLSRTILVAAVRQALVLKKVDVSLFNGHSFRIGAATVASQAGLSDSTIMQLGRWKSSAFIRYIRPPVRSIAALSNSLVDSWLVITVLFPLVVTYLCQNLLLIFCIIYNIVLRILSMLMCTS